MSTTLTNGATVLTLPDDLQWVDEFAWSAVQSVKSYSVSGNLLIDRSVKLAGRPITLTGGAEFAWASRSVALTLQTWMQQTNPTLSLLYRGVTFAVAFDHSAPQPLEVTPVVDYADPGATDECFFTLRLITLG